LIPACTSAEWLLSAALENKSCVSQAEVTSQDDFFPQMLKSIMNSYWPRNFPLRGTFSREPAFLNFILTFTHSRSVLVEFGLGLFHC
jgi:hypothetical protein